MLDIIRNIRRKSDGVPVLGWDDINTIGEALVEDFCPRAMIEPQAIDLERLSEIYLRAEKDYQYLSHNGLYLGMTVFNDTDRVVIYDPYENRAEYISARAGTIIIDNSLLEEGQEHRFRFTLGHEIGHFLLHGPYFNYNPDQLGLFDSVTVEEAPLIQCRKSIIFNCGQHPKLQTPLQWMEWQANALSSAIIMPRKMVLKVADSYGSDLRVSYGRASTLRDKLAVTLTEIFNVSPDAALYRIRQLGVLKRESELSLDHGEAI